jgi:hypothetical protein
MLALLLEVVGLAPGSKHFILSGITFIALAPA